MRSALILSLASLCSAASVSVQTTSGLIQGSLVDGLSIFKGVRFGQSPTGLLRWAPPVAFTSTATQNATSLAPACVQQFPFAVAAINEKLFNTPPVPESEDCLFLNVWAPTTARPTPVVIWIYGGALAFGTASVPEYDGASLAASQNITIVSFNYRTNVFGFPTSPDLPTTGNNLGFLDQELAFLWVQQNIANFGGDPKQVTIMGQSAGAESVAAAVIRHSPGTAPFRAGIMISGAVESTSPTPSFAAFNAMASAVGCTQAAGATRLACLKKVPAATIRAYTNSASSGTWTASVDGVTLFTDPLQRIRNKLSSGVPFMIGHTQDDGSLFALNQNNLATYLATNFGSLVTPAQVRALYPSGLSDNLVISEVVKDFLFLCPAELWGAAAVGAGQANVYRYAYGAVFPNMQSFPNAGAWHSSDLFEIFGTYNRTGATAAEATLASTMETVYGNFIKDPTSPPAPNWPRYVPGTSTNTLAKLAYSGNVALSNVVQAAGSNSLDGPCDTLWNKFLDVRE
ncbi:Carboxylesterase [Mycena filopes]|nr:Carboxylesterase [Mycena filopes]